MVNNNLGPGPGRPKGSKDKVPQSIKEALSKALELVGDQKGESKGVEQRGAIAYFAEVAEKDPKTFCGLVSKLIPNEVAASVDGTIKVEIVDFKDNPAPE